MGDTPVKAGTDTRTRPSPKGGISFSDAYLLMYNTACAVGWNLTLYKIGNVMMAGGGVRDAVEATHDIVVALQLVSTLEFVHACVGLVRCTYKDMGRQDHMCVVEQGGDIVRLDVSLPGGVLSTASVEEHTVTSVLLLLPRQLQWNSALNQSCSASPQFI